MNLTNYQKIQLSTGTSCGNKPAFYQHACTSKSQIDYVLVQDKSLISSNFIMEQPPICFSVHVSVKVTLTTTLCSVNH